MNRGSTRCALMSSNKRAFAVLGRSSIAPGVAVGFAVLIGGCSADVTRVDFPVSALTEKGAKTAPLPTPPETMSRRSSGYDDGRGAPPRGAGLSDAGRG